MTPGPMEERLARAALSRVGEPDDKGLRRLVAVEGAVGAWASLRRGDGRCPGGRLTGLLARAAATNPERDLARIEALGGRLVCPGDAEWPVALDELDHLDQPAPFALWLRGGGNLRTLAARGVAMVGARAATAYGARVAGDLGAELAGAGCCVVSGGAYGIDGAAHRGALVMDRPTVVVLACGVDVAYPRGHAALLARAASAGLILSEAPPGALAMRHRFLIRNRLIAALGLGTVVVEAAIRSGALSTAGHAERLSKPVMAVPGPIGSALSAGCHQLIRERNAILVTSADHVLEVVSPAGQGMLNVARAVPRPGDELSAECRRILDVVPVRTAVSTVRIAVAAGIDPRAATGELAVLAAGGFVARDAGGWRLAPAYRLSLAERATGP
jgi:DNA processing protein